MKRLNCKQCGVLLPRQRTVFCSRKCYAIWQTKDNPNTPFKKGKEHPNWKHGRSYDAGWKKEQDAIYKEDHKDRIREVNREWYKRNSASVLEKRKKYYIEHYDRVLNNARNQKARRKGADGKHTSFEWELLKLHYNYMCLCCKRFEPEIKLTEDHVIPIKMGGTNDIGNIQPLCMECNIRKSVKNTDFRFAWVEQYCPEGVKNEQKDETVTAEDRF